MRIRGPETFWRMSIWLQQRRLTWLAKIIKIINYLTHRALLPYEAQVGTGLVLEHYAFGVVIHPNVTIGNDVRIYHQVTIAGEMPIGAPERVRIGDRVTIGAHAVILPRPYQGLSIGEDAVIGAGAVVTGDVPPRAVMVGVPAKMVRQREITPPAAVDDAKREP